MGARRRCGVPSRHARPGRRRRIGGPSRCRPGAACGPRPAGSTVAAPRRGRSGFERARAATGTSKRAATADCSSATLRSPVARRPPARAATATGPVTPVRRAIDSSCATRHRLSVDAPSVSASSDRQDRLRSPRSPQTSASSPHVRNSVAASAVRCWAFLRLADGQPEGDRRPALVPIRPKARVAQLRLRVVDPALLDETPDQDGEQCRLARAKVVLAAKLERRADVGFGIAERPGMETRQASNAPERGKLERRPAALGVGQQPRQMGEGRFVGSRRPAAPSGLFERAPARYAALTQGLQVRVRQDPRARFAARHRSRRPSRDSRGRRARHESTRTGSSRAGDPRTGAATRRSECGQGGDSPAPRAVSSRPVDPEPRCRERHAQRARRPLPRASACSGG